MSRRQGIGSRCGDANYPAKLRGFLLAKGSHLSRLIAQECDETAIEAV